MKLKLKLAAATALAVACSAWLGVGLCLHRKPAATVTWNPRITWSTNADGRVVATVIETEAAIYLMGISNIVIKDCVWR